MTTYLLGIAVTLSIYGLLAISLDLLIGYAGLFTIVQGGLFGVGAYAAAIAGLSFGFGFWESAALSLIAGGAVSLLIAVPALRVSGHYLVLASFGVQEVLSSLYLNLDRVTGGAGGLRGVPRPTIFGLPIASNWQYLVLYVLILAAAILFLRRLVASPFGLLLQGVREDELVPQALGKNIVRLKVKTFAVSGALAGLAGALYAQYVTFVSPEAFDVHASIFILSMVLVGGMGTLWGPLLGAAVLVVVPELLRFLPISSTHLGPLRQIIYGAILVVFCFARPQGLVRGRGGAEWRLRLDDVKKTFGGLPAVRGVTAEVVPGEIVGLVGPNGAGKTTIFNLVSGLIRPTSGRVFLDDRDITGSAPHRIARMGIGRTFQQTRIFHHLRVVENVVFARKDVDDRLARALAVGSGTRRRREEEATSFLERFGLGSRAGDYGGDLSYAEQKLVMLACLCAGGARILLLDEPTAGLDPGSQRTVIDAVVGLRSPERLIVLIEHNLDVVRGCCDRVLFLAQGEVLATGTPAEVEADSRLRDLYFGTA